MDRIRHFLDGVDTSVLEAAWRHMSLPPHRLGLALVFLASVIAICELTRIALCTEHTRSRIAHVSVALLTFPIQSIFLAIVLVHAAQTYPGRGWINLAIALGMYVLWFVTGQATRLVRRVSEGADLGFMCVGALITFPVGVIAALVYRG
jgi:hypothetical protein